MWLAFESGRYEWIVGVVRWCIGNFRNVSSSGDSGPVQIQVRVEVQFRFNFSSGSVSVQAHSTNVR